MTMNNRQIEACERRMVAIHEAGHIVVVRQLGFEIISGWIERNDSAASDERTWIGRVQVYGLANPLHRQMVGAAGTLAELFWNDGDAASFDYLDMSASDAELAGIDQDDEIPDPFWEAVNQVGDMLSGEACPRVLKEARQLICEAR